MTSTKDFVKFLRGLRAVRRFRPDPVPRQAIDDVLAVARWTGSTANRQPWELILVCQRATVRALAVDSGRGGLRHLADAALAVVLVQPDDRSDFDGGRLAERILLTLAAHGLGASMAEFVAAEQVATAKSVLEVPNDRTLRYAVSVGYPADDQAHLVTSERVSDTRLPLRKLPVGRKPITEFAYVERYGRPWPK